MLRCLVQTFGGDGTLVQRGHGRIWLTEAGDLLLRYSESMVEVATEAAKALFDYRCAGCGGPLAQFGSRALLRRSVACRIWR